GLMSRTRCAGPEITGSSRGSERTPARRSDRFLPMDATDKIFPRRPRGVQMRAHSVPSRKRRGNGRNQRKGIARGLLIGPSATVAVAASLSQELVGLSTTESWTPSGLPSTLTGFRVTEKVIEWVPCPDVSRRRLRAGWRTLRRLPGFVFLSCAEPRSGLRHGDGGDSAAFGQRPDRDREEQSTGDSCGGPDPDQGNRRLEVRLHLQIVRDGLREGELPFGGVGLRVDLRRVGGSDLVGKVIAISHEVIGEEESHHALRRWVAGRLGCRRLVRRHAWVKAPGASLPGQRQLAGARDRSSRSIARLSPERLLEVEE